MTISSTSVVTLHLELLAACPGLVGVVQQWLSLLTHHMSTRDCWLLFPVASAGGYCRLHTDEEWNSYKDVAGGCLLVCPPHAQGDDKGWRGRSDSTVSEMWVCCVWVSTKCGCVQCECEV